MQLGKFTKQPGEIEAYGIKYDDATENGESLLTATAAVVDLSGATSTMNVSSCSIDGKEVRLLASNGTNGSDYKITVTVDTSIGRRMEDELIVKVREV